MIRSILFTALMFAVGAAGALVARHSGLFDAAPAVGTGPAPGFELTAQDGHRLALADLRGKAVVLSFAFTRCGDICPVAIYKLIWMQDELGPVFGEGVQFVTVTVDPEHDTPAVLADYAETIGARTEGWSFLTGPADRVAEVARRYGVYAKPAGEEGVDHILLTSLIDRDGVIRVQYLGERFDADEMLADIRALIAGEVSG